MSTMHTKGASIEAVFRAARGGRSTQEIMRTTGLPEGAVLDCLSVLVNDGRLVGLPRPAPWYVFWAWNQGVEMAIKAAAAGRLRLPLDQALDLVDETLPDGAWMEALCNLTGLDAGQVSSQLQRLKKGK